MACRTATAFGQRRGKPHGGWANRAGIPQLRFSGHLQYVTDGDTMATTDTQPSQENAEIARRVAEEAWGSGDLDILDEYLADGFVSHNTGAPEDVEGVEAYKALIGEFRSAMPDMTVQVEESFASDGRVALRFSMAGTHEGELMGIAPTGTEVRGEGLAIVHFEGEKVAEVWEYADQLGLLVQLGVVELPEA